MVARVLIALLVFVGAAQATNVTAVAGWMSVAASTGKLISFVHDPKGEGKKLKDQVKKAVTFHRHGKLTTLPVPAAPAQQEGK